MVYDIFGQQVADYSGASLQRENIYRGGQLLSVIETPTAAAPSSLAAVPSSGGSSITLSWSAASGATNYRVERKGAGGSFALAGTSASTGFTDNGVTTGNAYLYKVCAADGQNNCTSSYTNIALGATVTFPTDPTITSIVDDPTGVNVTKVKSAHITELRSAVNAVRSLAGLSNAGWTHPAATGDPIYADDVRDLRSALDEALVQLAIQTSTYTDSPLAGAPNGTLIQKTHITELRERTKSGSGGTGSGGSSGGVRYVLSDVQGSSRAVMNGTYGSSAIVARHDYLPFGQEIGLGTGLRTGTQGYGASDTNRKKYGLTERDDTTGLDHTRWRKYENTAGRWTSPDPLAGNIANPQSFNRYSYVQNDPVNFLDPSGLNPVSPGTSFGGGILWTLWFGHTGEWRKVFEWFEPYGSGGGGIHEAGHTGQEAAPVDKGYAWWGPCNRSASDLMRTVRRDFSKFGNYSETVASGQSVNRIRFDSGPISQGRTIGITLGAMSTSVREISRIRNMSVTVSSANTMSFTFTTNPGHVFYPGTISFSARDTDSGVRFGIDLKGQLGDWESRVGFFFGGEGFEDRAWWSFLGEVKKSCGNE